MFVVLDEKETRFEKLSLAGVPGLDGGFGDADEDRGDVRPATGAIGLNEEKALLYVGGFWPLVGLADQSKPLRSFILDRRST